MIAHPVRALLHGTGAIVSVIGSVLLLRQHAEPALAIYAVTLVGMYSASTLYHAVRWGQAWKVRMQKVDHAFIYLLVAGTFTALIVGSMRGSARGGALIVIWALAAFGIVHEVLPALARRFTLMIQQCLGAVALLPVAYLLSEIEESQRLLILGGGMIYTGGVAMFVRSWPRLLPGVFGFHETFHVLVVAASLAHFLAIWQIWV